MEIAPAPTKNGSLNVQFNVRIRYLAIAISLVLLAVAALSVWYYLATDDTIRRSIAYGSSLLAATVAICALLYNAENIRKGNDEKRVAAASKFIERWNHPNYFTLRSKWRALTILMESDPNGMSERMESNEEVENRSVAVEFLNFFEEVAIAVNQDILDQVLLREFFNDLMTRTYKVYRPWIMKHRISKDAPEYWVNMESVANRWTSR